MGERNKKSKAIILSVKDYGETNRSVTALSPDFGIIYLTLYGGPKSKLKSYVQTFNSGILYFYDDELKHSKKISDFDVKNSHYSFRSNLYKLYAANLACEIVLKTKCAGDYFYSFKYLSGFLDGLELSDENECKLGTVRFLWRYLHLLGTNPDIYTCASCASSLLKSQKNFYYENENAFVCGDCLSSLTEDDLKTAKDFCLDQNSLTYLAAINELSPSEVRKLSLSQENYLELKNICFHLIQKQCDFKLNSLKVGFYVL